jgi:hypothetical protein
VPQKSLIPAPVQNGGAAVSRAARIILEKGVRGGPQAVKAKPCGAVRDAKPTKRIHHRTGAAIVGRNDAQDADLGRETGPAFSATATKAREVKDYSPGAGTQVAQDCVVGPVGSNLQSRDFRRAEFALS